MISFRRYDRQLARGEGKTVFTVSIHYIGTSGKTACSVHPIVELFCHTNVWKWAVGGVKVVSQWQRACIPCILILLFTGKGLLYIDA